jgi:hypothetical protein
VSASKCATCGTPVQQSTAAAIVWTTPPRFWCFACWDGGDTAVEQYRAAQMDEIVEGFHRALQMPRCKP